MAARAFLYDYGPPPLGYAGPEAYAAGDVLIGEDPLRDPPHESDWWVTTDDALEYAEWLERRIADYETQLAIWAAGPELAGNSAALVKRGQVVKLWLARSDWATWRADWTAYLKNLHDNWASWGYLLGGPLLGSVYDPRVNSWYKTRDKWHREFLEHAESTKRLGGPDSQARLPVDPLEQKGLGLGLPNAAEVGDLGWGIGAILIGAAAVIAARALK